jgi:hypothetical protein
VLLLDRRTFEPTRRLHRHGRRVSLTAIFDIHHATLGAVACGADERVLLAATDMRRVVWHHAVRINSAPHAVQRIGRTPTNTRPVLSQND